MDNILTLKSMTILLGQKQNDLVFKIHFWVTSIKREEFTYQPFAYCSMPALNSVKYQSNTFCDRRDQYTNSMQTSNE